MTNIIKLNVGGVLYQTTQDTLTKDQDSMLASMFSGRHPLKPDENGYHFIDRDGKLFEYILKFLRDDKIYLKNIPDVTLECILDEANYYCLSRLINFIGDNMKQSTPQELEDDNRKKIENIKMVCAAKNFDINEFEKNFNEKLNLTYIEYNYWCYTNNTNDSYYRLSDTYFRRTVYNGVWHPGVYKQYFGWTGNGNTQKALYYNFLYKAIEKLGHETFESLFSKNIIKTDYKCVKHNKTNGDFEFYI